MSKDQTHCKEGHAFDEENTYVTAEGRRQCRACLKHTQAVNAVLTLVAMQRNPDHPKHGTTTGYQYGCRCHRCGFAHSEAGRAWRARRKAKRAA